MATTIVLKNKETDAPSGSTAAIIGEPLFQYATDGSIANLYMGYHTDNGDHVRVGARVDAATIGTNSDNRIPTQKAVKTYVDAQEHTPETADISDVSVTQTELAELETLGSTSISSANWVALSNLSGTNSGQQTINAADIADVSVTQAELSQLETIGSTTIEAADWTAVAAMSGTNTGDSRMAFNGSTGDGIATYGGDADTVDISAMASVTATNINLTHAGSGFPRIALTGSAGDIGPSLLFDRKATGAAGKVIGTMYYYGDDASDNAAQLYAQIDGAINNATHGSETGKIQLKVAEYDGTLGTGLTVAGAAANGQIDVTLGLGTGSTTTVAGNLTVNGTTTTINSTVLTVDDDKITVSSGNDTLTNADGSGMEVDSATGTNPSWIYKHSTTSWNSNQNVDIDSGKAYYIAGSSILSATALAAAVQVPVGCFNSGTSAATSTFLNGDGEWTAPVGTYSHPNHSGEVTSSGDGATVVVDNVVDEANLKVSNGPTNGYVLTAQSGNTGGLTWAAETDTINMGSGFTIAATTNTAATTVTQGDTVTMTAGTSMSVVATSDGVVTFNNSAPHIATDISWTAGTTAGPICNSSTGADVAIPSASGSASGAVTTGAQTFAGVKTMTSPVFITPELGTPSQFVLNGGNY